MNTKTIKSISIIIIFLIFHFEIKAQEIKSKKDNRIYTSIDYTIFGPQGSLAYDFYTLKGRCFGFSVSQAMGLYQINKDPTIYYNMNEIRLNLSFRHTNTIFESKVVDAFFIIKAGISYNSLYDKNTVLILPSFNVGSGLDIKLIKSSGIRLEAGIGSPYCSSIGYFFKY
jgi:hypothetical protein